ncbi:MAG: IS200/IS605 family element transposase accessory protein TnpB [Tissierellia bacterium]|nr:IS200/IS605 family element transposase accessory protein TnpB [Tissierellia bacterium]
MKTVIKGYKYRIYPTDEQKELINKTFGCSRFVHNYFLAMKIELYKTEQKSLSYSKCSSLLTELKKEKEWLKEVDKFALQNSLKDLNTAYQNFFREHKKGNTNQGFPKFKSKKNNYKSYRTNFTNNNIEIDFEKGQIKLPKLKWIKCKTHRKFTGKILSVTISQVPSGKYYVSLNVECEHEELPKANNSIGLDLGISDLLITSNGQTFENNKLTYKYEKKLAKLQRQLSKKQKGSKNFNKQRIKIAKLHEKITNIRVDNLHKISSQIVKENQFIFSEDLNIKGMIKNPKLAKSIQDVSWYELIRQLQYKSKWNNRVYHKVDRFYASSQICNNCNYKNEKIKNLSIRKWTCPECGTYHNRDINASINILNQGLKDLELAV